MKKIGQGLQFNVYDLGNRVKKTFTSKNQIRLKLIFWNLFLIFQPPKLEEIVNKAIKEREHSINELKKREIDLSLLANLKIYEKEIIQDKVTLIKSILGDYERDKKIINDYIQFIFKCWKQGFADRIYNFTINNGLDSYRRIVLIDCGELTFDKGHIEEAIKNKRWEGSRTYKSHLYLKLKGYYKEKMDKEITLENLNKYWKSL